MGTLNNNNDTKVLDRAQENLLVKAEKGNEESLQNRSFRNKIKEIKANLTVEPVLFTFVTSSVMAMFAAQNLNLSKSCKVNLGFGNAICADLERRIKANHTLEDVAVQRLTASIYIWKSIVNTAVPCVLMLFMGSWSDKTGKRKICMLMPIFGEFSTYFLNIMNTYLFYQVSVEWTVLMEVIMPSLTGGWYTMFLGTFSYLGDITTRGNRTFRVGILQMCMTIGFPLGITLSGLLLKYSGFYGVFGVSAAMQLANFFYVFFALEEHTWLDNREKVLQKRCKSFLSSFFDIRSLKKTMEIVFKKGNCDRRLRMILVLTVVVLTFGPLRGETIVMYLFAQFKFNWNYMQYSVFSAYNVIVHIIGTIFALSILSRKLKFDDATLGILSTISKICGASLLAFASSDVQAYLAPLLDILSGTAMIALRSITSKLVSYQELGKVYSLFGIAETFTPLIFESTYPKLYKSTFTVLPGAFLLLSVLVTIPALAIFGWFHREHIKDRKGDKLGSPLRSQPETAFESA